MPHWIQKCTCHGHIRCHNAHIKCGAVLTIRENATVRMSAHRCQHVLACANMCGHSQYLWDKSFGTYSGALIWPMCWHVSTPGNIPTCANMCKQVTPSSAPVIPIIWTLSGCQYVSVPVDMPTCADMCWHVVVLVLHVLGSARWLTLGEEPMWVYSICFFLCIFLLSVASSASFSSSDSSAPSSWSRLPFLHET